MLIQERAQMKILKLLVLSLAGLILLLGAVGLLLPQQVRVERATVIAAKPATVFVYLNGFKNFNQWSPWAALDPKTQYSYEGPLMGVGAKQSWASDDPNVGRGSQQITAVEFNQSITMQLMLPNMQPSVVTQTLIPEGEGTKVVWAMQADLGASPLNRWFGLLLPKFIGPDYEKGLASMKPLIEALPKHDLSGVTLVTTEARPALTVSDSASAAGDGAEVGAKLGAAYGKISVWMKANGFEAADAPIAITRKFDEQTKFWEFDAGMIVNKPGAAPAADTGIQVISTYAGPALKFTHVGSYITMEPSYERMNAFMIVAGLANSGNLWDHYVDDPTTKPEAEVKTDIYWPVK